jgi:transcriptional regulator of met regulon
MDLEDPIIGRTPAEQEFLDAFYQMSEEDQDAMFRVITSLPLPSSETLTREKIEELFEAAKRIQ